MTLQCRQEKRLLSFYIFSLSITLTIVGLVFIYSASSIYAMEKLGSANYFLRKQTIYFLISLFVFAIGAVVPLEKLEKFAIIPYISFLLLTLSTIIPKIGTKIHGASRWIKIANISIQPGELLSVCAIIYVVSFLSKRAFDYTWISKKSFLFFMLLGLAPIALLLQPDFGAVITLFLTLLGLFVISGIQLRQFVVLLAASIPVVVFLIISKPYRLQRIMSFLHPWSDPKGKGFQIIQALIAIGSGSMWGTGLSFSKQKFFYLPMQHTDFIFPIVAEEIGFVGSSLIILAFVGILLLGFRLVSLLKKPFFIYLATGFVSFISIKTIINLSVVTGMLPTKGLALPFLSYGGTSLISNFFMIGIITNCARSDI